MLNRKLLVFLFMSWIFLLAGVSAQMTISDVQSVYSLGDRILLDVMVNPSMVRGNFEINLVCSGERVNFYRISPAESAFFVGEEQRIDHRIILDKEFIGNLTGDCFVEAVLGDEKVSSNNFKISDSVKLDVSLDKSSYKPKDSLKVHLSAIKDNTFPLNGVVKIGGFEDSTGDVIDGVYDGVLGVPENMEAGNHELNVFVYDVDSDGNVRNSANSTLYYEVLQVPQSLHILMDNVEISPEDGLSIGADIYDQAGEALVGSVKFVLSSPSGEEREFFLDSGEIKDISFDSNATVGVWKIEVFYEDLYEEKEFQILPNPKVTFEFLENLLIIRNVGNVLFNDTIEVNIGDSLQELKLNIGLDEERKFSLKAPNGEYDVYVIGGSSELTQSMFLTGNAVGVDNEEGLNLFSKYPVIWVVLLVVLIALLFFGYRKYGRQGTSDFFKRVKKYVGKKKSKGFGKTGSNYAEVGSKKSASVAENKIVLEGEKSQSAIVAVKIDNLGELGSDTKERLKNVVNDCRGKGVVERKEDYLLMVYSPLITKTFDNEGATVRAGMSLLKQLNAQNKKYKEKIKFGVGVNAGELIANVDGGKLRYTSIGGTITLAKKMADLGGEGVLVSDHIKKKLKRDIRLDHVSHIGDMGVYRVIDLRDKEENQAKIKEILKRMEHK
jgi:hypothetical protein